MVQRNETISLSLPSILLKEIDKDRGDVSRSLYIVRLLETRKLSPAAVRSLEIQVPKSRGSKK